MKPLLATGVYGLALLTLPTISAQAQVTVIVVQQGAAGPRSLCRVELCNGAITPIQVAGGTVAQIATLGGFPVVAAGEEERARVDAEAGRWKTVRDTARKLTPIAIQAAAALSIAKRYPIALQGVLTVASVGVELIPDTPRSTLPYLRSSEMIALPALGCDVRYLRARTSGMNAPFHHLIRRQVGYPTFEFPVEVKNP